MPYRFDSPLGLKFSDCCRTDTYSVDGETYCEYSVSIENTGAMDISYNEEEYIYEIGRKPYDLRLMAVIRDSDGKIIDVADIDDIDDGPIDCASGEKTSIVVLLTGDIPEDASAEIYIDQIMELEEY